MSLTPDYFISSSGHPQLNREKYKLLPSGPSSAVAFLKSLPMISKNSKHLTCDSDNRRLLKKRGRYQANGSVISVTVTHEGKPCMWASDKELKCYINQQIKEMDRNLSELSCCSGITTTTTTTNTTVSHQQLDNRLTGEPKCFNGIFRDNQTDVVLLQS